MAYVAKTFTAGEQPSAAEWNKLTANDASFHDGTGIDNKVIISRHLEDLLRQGWFQLHKTDGTVEACTYVSADAPTFVFSVPADRSADISVGMRFTGTQATGGKKYYIVTAVAYDAGNARTLITVYGGTDYVMTSQAITAPAFSREKAPQGFPLDPDKWSVIKVDTANQAQSNPTQNSIYNFTSLNIDIPIGLWKVSWNGVLYGTLASAGRIDVLGGLSTANNTLAAGLITTRINSNYDTNFQVPSTREITLTLAAKATYYFNVLTDVTSITAIGILGGVATSVVKAVCAYL